jgi:hypothetical protein
MPKQVDTNKLPGGLIDDEEAWVGKGLPEGFTPFVQIKNNRGGNHWEASKLWAVIRSLYDSPDQWRLVKVFDKAKNAGGNASSARKMARTMEEGLTEAEIKNAGPTSKDWCADAKEHGGHFQTAISDVDLKGRVTLAARFVVGNRKTK